MAQERRYDQRSARDDMDRGNGDYGTGRERGGEDSVRGSQGERAFGRDMGHERDYGRGERRDREPGRDDYGYGHAGSSGTGSGQDFGYGRSGSEWPGVEPRDYGRAYGRDEDWERQPWRRTGGDGDRTRRPGDRGFLDRASDVVSSWFGDRDAERRRDQDQYRGRGPKNYTRSDERMREDVCDRLTDDPAIDASEIEVQVGNCEVTLSGTVETREQRRRAEDCAERVSGVKHVQNNLRVQPNGRPGMPQGAPATSVGIGSAGAEAGAGLAPGSGRMEAAGTASNPSDVETDTPQVPGAPTGKPI